MHAQFLNHSVPPHMPPRETLPHAPDRNRRQDTDDGR